MTTPSDTQFLLNLLRTGGPQTRETVIDYCRYAGRPGMVVNSRVAELRKQGHSITCERRRVDGRRDEYVYSLAREAVAA